MAQVIAEQRDIDFVMFEQFESEKLCEIEKYSDFDKKTFKMIIAEARKFAIKEILPTMVEGDRNGAKFENGMVHVPECFRRPYKLFVEGEWTAMTADPELGGQGLPFMVAQAASEYFTGANYAFAFHGFESHAAGKMIEVFGTELQKKLFLKKMYTGEWGGTMDLTEPGAGSDVGALTTTARKNEDGTYSITGNKIFITSGEHDLTDNIIHPVLARIEGAPAGSKGISLFIVPKIWVNEDGSLGEFNDIVCTGIEEKMGIHASATCSLTYGGNGGCRGLLLGEENQGMKVMFQMMNEARIMVGAIGLCCGSAAYLHALNYAGERLQGRALENIMDPSAPQVPIIQHPDVRRMLLWMKSHVEGIRSLLYYGISLIETETSSGSEKERGYAKDLLDILTPVIKAYCTDRGTEVCSQAIQVFGGYGYTSDFPVEQLYRDSRIAPIYEGTNGIQAMDMLGRKLGMKKGAVFMNLLAEINEIIAKAKEVPRVAPLADLLETNINKLGEVAMNMGKTAMSERFKTGFAHATPFLDVVGDSVCGWMLLWRATIAATKLEPIFKDKDEAAINEICKKNADAAYYQGQILSARFFMESVLPVTQGRMDSLLAGCSAAVDIPENAF